MADIEKVIKGLHYCTKLYLGCKECPYFGESDGKASCECKLKTDALELLKEQEAKQVTIAQAHFGMKYGLCPRCEKQIDTLVNPSFCGNCGQAVKWE